MTRSDRDVPGPDVPGPDDAVAALGAFAPRVHPPRLPEGDVSYCVDDTAVGRVLFAVSADGSVLATRYAPDGPAEDAVLHRLADLVSPRVLRSPAPTDDVRRQVGEYLHGRRRDFDLRVDLALATPFQRTVLRTLADTVPFGGVTTYGALAAAAGRAGASRAVGSALGANPVCVVVPCHRVLASGGGLSGYAGGPQAKRLLLRLESAD